MAVRATEERLSETMADLVGIVQSLTSDIQSTDDDQRIVNLTCIMAKVNRAMRILSEARMCYRAIDSGEYLGGDADV